MTENTKIQWATHTFNPWRGCSKVAAGCANCYAEAMSKRNPGTLGVWGPAGTRVVAAESRWREPLKWEREVETTAGEWPDHRHRVFCASLADVFEQWNGHVLTARGEVVADCRSCGYSGAAGTIPGAGNCCAKCKSGAITTGSLSGTRRRLAALWDATPSLDWLVLTKRPENIRRMWNVPAGGALHHHRRNVWIGTSISTQEDARRNINELLRCRDLCGKTFLSVEPLIERVDLWTYLRATPRPDWVIVGGESGPNARRCDVAWVRLVVRQCSDSGVPCFVKQLGRNIVDRNDAGFDAEWHDGEGWPDCVSDVKQNIDGYLTAYQGAPVLVRTPDPKGGDMSEWPKDLRVREFPE